MQTSLDPMTNKGGEIRFPVIIDKGFLHALEEIFIDAQAANIESITSECKDLLDEKLSQIDRELSDEQRVRQEEWVRSSIENKKTRAIEEAKRIVVKVSLSDNSTHFLQSTSDVLKIANTPERKILSININNATRFAIHISIDVGSRWLSKSLSERFS